MTITEFENTNWTGNTKFLYRGNVYKVASVNFEEALIGYCSDYDSEIQWVRCENIILTN